MSMQPPGRQQSPVYGDLLFAPRAHGTTDRLPGITRGGVLQSRSRNVLFVDIYFQWTMRTRLPRLLRPPARPARRSSSCAHAHKFSLNHNNFLAGVPMCVLARCSPCSRHFEVYPRSQAENQRNLLISARRDHSPQGQRSAEEL